jgi:hypothetical protein
MSPARLGRACALVAIVLVFSFGGAAPAKTTTGSLDRLADVLVERARPSLEPPRALDVGVVVAAPWPRLASDLAELVAARVRGLGARSVVVVKGGGGDAAWARANGLERVVRVDVDAAGAMLRASGAVLALDGGLWSDAAETRAHLYAEAPLDAELKAYLPGPLAPPGAWQARGLAVGDLDVLALDVGDTDGDGRAELVAATTSELYAWSFQPDAAGARLVERWRARLDVRPAAVRPRADVASVVVDGGAVIARASTSAEGVRRTARGLEPARGFRFHGVPAACELEPGVDWFTPASCGAPPQAPNLAPSSDWPEKFWSAAGLKRADSSTALAAIVPGGAGGVLWLKLGPSPPLLVRGVGAQVTLAALDRGEVVVTSEPSEPGEPDAIVIRALAQPQTVLHRVEKLPGAVRALAAGDLDGDGQPELVAAVRDEAARRTEIWIVR